MNTNAKNSGRKSIAPTEIPIEKQSSNCVPLSSSDNVNKQDVASQRELVLLSGLTSTMKLCDLALEVKYVAHNGAGTWQWRLHWAAVPNEASSGHDVLPLNHALCTDKDLRNLASRLKDWFGALHEDANRLIKPTSTDGNQGRFDTSILPICKDSLGWMFNKLDMNYDLLLDHTEINAIYLDKYEPCIKPLFNSCDSFKDGKLSNNEWCYCFQKPEGLPCQNEMNRIQKLNRGRNLLGAFIPRCNEEGYYKATQCHGSTGQCWCVDKYGNELAGSRKQGAVTCEEEQETSGDFGSGGSVILLDDLEDEHEALKTVKERKLKLHIRATNDDDEDEDDDKDDEFGYIW